MVVLDATIVNVALPSIQRGLRFSPSGLQWVINMYTLIFGGFMVLGGRAGDLIGRKRVFLAGILLSSGASLLNGLAQSSAMLIAGRGLQGLGGALLAPAVLSIITTTFSDGKDRAKAMAIWSAIAAGGGAVGLLLGGVLTDLASWRWIFFVNVPVGGRSTRASGGELDARGRVIAFCLSVQSGVLSEPPRDAHDLLAE
jgi:MFS family permease